MDAFLNLLPPWLMAEAPVMVVVLPLIMAAITALLPKGHLSWLVVTIVTALCTVLSLAIVLVTLGGENITYALGGWDPPLGITYDIDGLNAPVLFLISIVAFVTSLYALPSVAAEIEPKKRAPFYAAFLVSFAGLLGMVTTGDAFNVFVFLEISSISTYVLVAMGASRDRRALKSAYNYLILGSIGATFFVLGVGFLYAETGTLNMADMAERLAATNGTSRVTQVAFAFIVIGLGLKLAMFPLHLWLPGAYAYAPSFITAFLAATATKAALYLILRFTFTIFTLELNFQITYLIAGLGILGMVLASVQAIFQTDVRRVLAFSSVAQVGYMLLGVGMATGFIYGTQEGSSVAAGYLHLLNHAIIKGGLFLCVGAMWYRFGITRVSDFKGLGKKMPLTMAAFTILALSLIGVPFTAGFVSKLALIEAAGAANWWWAIGLIVFTSLLAVIYMGRILEQAYLANTDGLDCSREEAPMMMLIPMWVMAAGSVYFGIRSDFPVALARGAAEVMMGG